MTATINAGFFSNIWNGFKGFGKWIGYNIVQHVHFTGKVVSHTATLNFFEVVKDVGDELEFLICEVPSLGLSINYDIREDWHIRKYHSKHRNSPLKHGEIDPWTKKKLSLYDHLYPNLDLKKGKILDQIIIHSGDLPTPDFVEGRAVATTMGNHIFFREDYLVPDSTYYSYAGAIRKDVLEYAERWQKPLGLFTIFKKASKKGNSISKREFKIIQRRIDFQYEINFARLAHELYHVNQVVEMGGYQKQACSYMLEMMHHKYHFNRFEQPAWKLQALIYADFAKSRKKFKYADQDGQLACIPSIIFSDTWCHSRKSCKYQPYGNSLASCTVKPGKCSKQDLLIVEKNLKLIGKKNHTKNMSEKFIKAWDRCAFFDNCPQKFNPNQKSDSCTQKHRTISSMKQLKK